MLTSIEADKQAVEEIAAQIAGSKEHAEGLLGQFQALGVKVEGHALSFARQTLEECVAQCAALGRQFEEAKVAAEAVKGGGSKA
ncbi:hypothetical protein GCM10028833_30190 [Glycomyces tarimensis]